MNLQEHPKEGVHVQDLSSFITKNTQEIEHVMTTGNLNRSTGATNMNEHSSRSHAIFVITVESSEVKNERLKMKIKSKRMFLDRSRWQSAYSSGKIEFSRFGRK